MIVQQSIGELMTERAASFGRKKYLFFKGKKISYKETEQICNKISRTLIGAGVKKGDRVAVMIENSPEFIFSMFGIIKAGAVLVPINTFLKEKEVSYIVENCEASILISSSNFSQIIKGVRNECKSLKTVFAFSEESASWGAIDLYAHLNNVSDRPVVMPMKPSDLAVIIYTSGTTGNPKGAMLSHNNLLSMVVIAGNCYKMTKKDRFLLFLPMFHIYSLEVSIMFSLYLGASIIILESVMDLKKKNFKSVLIFKRPTVMTAVPSVYAALVKANMPKWFIKFIYPIKFHLSSGSGLPPEVFENFKKKFGVGIIEGYGLSETSPVVTGNSIDNPIAGSVGKALEGVTVKIVNQDEVEVAQGEVGEIIAKGPNVMQGYWKMPKETAEVLKNGWFFTGDLGTMDEEGNVRIVDRKKDLILVKGMNVYPREIEDQMYKINGIEAAAVLGIPDNEGDEIIISYVKKDPEANISEKSIKQFLKENLANFKIPKHIYFSDELPLTTIGKVLKRKLKEMVQKGQIEGPLFEMKRPDVNPVN